VQSLKNITQTNSHKTDPLYYTAWYAAAFAAISTAHEIFTRTRAKMQNNSSGANSEQPIPVEWSPKPAIMREDEPIDMNICAFAFVRMKVSFFVLFSFLF